ncbi:hypothetical protein [Pseudonocardia asaccharolytica]|uniref:Uncharacterized protein n=1 Tax=Pseudonocardia asaccharolytica DSM 44247 = NBRC 16224 TaxID=1123024 RepID=A0A511D264_9PSEU|nr:hypothetical protein [Pseudonocardia asaccharolytica]GEL18869.1 hypothetical protein PA7_27060 [Pseudonocardia asaccharolytica DSM 44247 = NBRC 16224]
MAGEDRDWRRARCRPGTAGTGEGGAIDDNHRCPLPTPVDAGDEFLCTCRSRYVAVRRRWWLRWERNLFSLPDGSTATGRSHPPDQAPREIG